MEKIDPNKWGVVLRFSQIIALVIGTAYFIIFIYQMRDAIADNIRENNKNQAQLIAKQDESIKVQKKIACLLKWHIYEPQKPYKGECDNGFIY